jgi:hypothetical protein
MGPLMTAPNLNHCLRPYDDPREAIDTRWAAVEAGRSERTIRNLCEGRAPSDG